MAGFQRGSSNLPQAGGFFLRCATLPI
jgi:CspA family cold shock protein